jgi:hypothetical protein
MRNLILVLIAFIAIVTFIKAYDGHETNPAEVHGMPAVELPSSKG